MGKRIYRTIASATYTPAAERTDDADWCVGDVTYVRFDECDHVKLGNPTMHYKVGTPEPCFYCAENAAAEGRNHAE